MYLAISLALVAMVILVFFLDWKLQKTVKSAEYWRLKANEEGKNAEYWRAMNNCCMQEASALRKQAEAFEQAAKTMEAKADYFETMLHKCEEERDWLKENQNLTVNCTSTEEHLAAERGWADRLAKALRMSEDARCELKQQLEKMRKQVNTTGSTILDEMKRRGEKPVFTAVMQRDLANIMAYNGTEQSQEDLTNE